MTKKWVYLFSDIDQAEEYAGDWEGVRSLLVNKRCKNLITELTDTYRYPEQGSRRDDEKPLDGNDHACDALRYWVHLRAR